MGRPVEVHDEDIIAAGLRLESRGIEVKATRLWTELGERGLGLTRFRGHPEAFTRGVPDAQNPPTVFA